MNHHLSPLVRRTTGIAFATTLLAGSIAGTASAASPAGDVGQWEHDTRDALGQTAVLAVYPTGADDELKTFRVRGPKVAWLESHPLPEGNVGWRVIIQSAPTKNGPWTYERKSPMKLIVADKEGSLDAFANRTVYVGEVDGQYVRAVTKLFWINEDGGTMGWVRHVYAKYGLIESSGETPAFGGQTATRRDAAPATWQD